jgi:hypothetical protein
MGISIRAYARQRGVSDTAVRKAIHAGRITLDAEGKVDPVQADLDWQRNTDQAQQRKGFKAVPNEAIRALQGEVPKGHKETKGMTFLEARTANEVLKAHTNKLRLARLKGEVIDRAQALSHVHALARAEREAWLNWPSRIAAVLASELGVEAARLMGVLEREVRAHLTELGALPVRLDQ